MILFFRNRHRRKNDAALQTRRLLFVIVRKLGWANSGPGPGEGEEKGEEENRKKDWKRMDKLGVIV